MNTLRTFVIMAIAFIAFLGTPTRAGGGLDLSNLEFSDDIIQLIREHIPDDLDTLLSSWSPEVYPQDFKVCLYHSSSADSTPSALIMYMTDGSTTAALQLYRRVGQNWHFLSQTRDVRASQPSWFSLRDLDCDGSNEVLIQGAVGMGGFQYTDIFAIVGDSLERMTNRLCGVELEGRTIEFKQTTQPCGWELEVTQDGPQKFEVGEVRTYRLDAASKTFKLVSDQKVPQQQK